MVIMVVVVVIAVDDEDDGDDYDADVSEERKKAIPSYAHRSIELTMKAVDELLLITVCSTALCSLRSSLT